jgi:hypothetical protein
MTRLILLGLGLAIGVTAAVIGSAAATERAAPPAAGNAAP